MTVPKKGGSVEHVRAADAATLVYLAGQACITLHARLSRRDRLRAPRTGSCFDLDPSVDRTGRRAPGGAPDRDLLRELGLEPWAMTTGSRGYHVVVPLQRRLGFDDVRAFARDVGAVAARREPQLFTIEQRKAKRGDRVLIDVMRNGYAQTAVAPYAVRARPGAPVATPLHWDELSDGRTRADRWTIKTIGRRLDSDGDPWKDIAAKPATLTQARSRLAREAALTSVAQAPRQRGRVGRCVPLPVVVEEREYLARSPPSGDSPRPRVDLGGGVVAVASARAVVEADVSPGRGRIVGLKRPLWMIADRERDAVGRRARPAPVARTSWDDETRSCVVRSGSACSHVSSRSSSRWNVAGSCQSTGPRRPASRSGSIRS